MNDPLLEPFQTKHLTFKNRMVHAPTTMNMSDDRGYVTEKGIGAYEALAKGGFGAVCVGATCVRWDGLINERMFGLYDDTYIISQRELVHVIHNNGALAGIQLFYGGLIPGLGATFPIEPGKGWIPGTVSWGPTGKYPIGNPKPGVLTTEDYRQLVEDFAQAGRRAKEAGYDYVSYHFCHGSLPHVTLSLLENSGRNDEYADQFLFCEQIIQRTAELCGGGFPADSADVLRRELCRRVRCRLLRRTLCAAASCARGRRDRLHLRLDAAGAEPQSRAAFGRCDRRRFLRAQPRRAALRQAVARGPPWPRASTCR